MSSVLIDWAAVRTRQEDAPYLFSFHMAPMGYSLLLKSNQVTARIPLGKLYCISGELPQVGKGVGRGTVLEALCGLRLVDGGYLGLPPHLRKFLAGRSSLLPSFHSRAQPYLVDTHNQPIPRCRRHKIIVDEPMNQP